MRTLKSYTVSTIVKVNAEKTVKKYLMGYMNGAPVMDEDVHYARVFTGHQPRRSAEEVAKHIGGDVKIEPAIRAGYALA